MKRLSSAVTAIAIFFVGFCPNAICIERSPSLQEKDRTVNPITLRTLIKEAKVTHSDALILIQDGRALIKNYFAHPITPIYAMSITKSITSLAIGMLIGEGKIPSVDTPLYTWYPEWKSGMKSKVTLRQVLTHTSGLRHGQNAGMLNHQRDRLRYVLDSPVEGMPGEHFSYNNEAVQLLAGVIRKAAGKPADLYLSEKLFKPMGIKSWIWNKDRAGNVDVYGGLALYPEDLAKIGQLILQGGRWKGKALVPQNWIREATSPADPQFPARGGYLWWVHYPSSYLIQTAESLKKFEQSGFRAAPKLSSLLSKRYMTPEGYVSDVERLLSKTEYTLFLDCLKKGPPPARIYLGEESPNFEANGWLGQYLLIYPRFGLIAVRMKRDDDCFAEERISFPNFPELVDGILRKKPRGKQ